MTERNVTAIVEVPVSSSDKTIRNWAISSDHMWLMPVPDKNSETAKNISQQIFADVEGKLLSYAAENGAFLIKPNLKEFEELTMQLMLLLQ